MAIPSDLPSEYTPSILTKEPRPEQMFCIGYRSALGGSSYSYLREPTPNLGKLLETVPMRDVSKEAAILFFDTDGTEHILYLWSKMENKWKRT